MKRLLMLLAAGILFLAACSDGDESDKAASSSNGKEEATTIAISATEYAFDMPAEVTGGVVQMQFTNDGVEPHEFILTRIEEGKTEADVKVALEGEGYPKWAEDMGGVAGLSPGESITVTRTLEPGSYVFLCFNPSPDGMPHALMGMYEMFTVTGDTGVALPESDATIIATDDGLQMDLISGEQTVLFENDGTDPHGLVLAAFEPGKSFGDMDQWFTDGYQGQSPGTLLGGTQPILAGESVLFTLDLEPGVEYTGIDFETGSQETFTGDISAGQMKAAMAEAGLTNFTGQS